MLIGVPAIPLMPLSTCEEARKMDPGIVMSGLLRGVTGESSVEVDRACSIRGEDDGEEVGESKETPRA